jgi:hypothetical protein
MENEQLFEFEELVNDDNGAYIEFNKVPAVEDDNDPKKKGGKGKGGEDVESLFSRGWIDFTPFMNPGIKHTVQRIPLKTVEPPKEEGEGEDDDEEDKPEAEGEGEQELEQVFENAQSYVYVHVSTEIAINPSIEPEEAPKKEEKVESEGEDAKVEKPEEAEGEDKAKEGEGEKEEPKEEEAKEEEAKEGEKDGEGEEEKEEVDSYVEEEIYIEDPDAKPKINDKVYETLSPHMKYFSTTRDATANFRNIIQLYLK